MHFLSLTYLNLLFENFLEAYNKEKEIVNKDFIKEDSNYNIATGGSVSSDWTEERKLYYREWLSGENHPMFGKKMSLESSLKKSNALILVCNINNFFIYYLDKTMFIYYNIL